VRRQPHHRLVAAVGEADVALDPDQAPEARRRCVPEQAALEEAAAEPAEVLLGEALAFAGAELGEAELEVAQGDLAARRHEMPAEAAHGTADRGLHAERQPVEQPQDRQQQARAQAPVLRIR
jgi:hypothetical protein